MSEKFNLENYSTVNERIVEFWKKYPSGRIVTNLTSIDTENATNRMVVVHAEVYADREPSSPPIATGLSKEREGSTYVNKTSFLENCETSAIGRALANLGFGVEKARPSREEMEAVARAEQEHKETLERIKELGKNVSASLKSKVKEKWAAAKDDIQTASRLLAELEEAEPVET